MRRKLKIKLDILGSHKDRIRSAVNALSKERCFDFVMDDGDYFEATKAMFEYVGIEVFDISTPYDHALQIGGGPIAGVFLIPTHSVGNYYELVDDFKTSIGVLR